MSELKTPLALVGGLGTNRKNPYPEEHARACEAQALIQASQPVVGGRCDHLSLAKRVKVYGASTFSRAAMWRQLRDEWSEHVEFTNRWAQRYIDVPDAPELARIGWQHNREDVMASNVVLVYAEPEDLLRGCLIEAGMALAWGIPVIVVGDHPNYHSWACHPGVSRVPDLPTAKEVIILHGVQR